MTCDFPPVERLLPPPPSPGPFQSTQCCTPQALRMYVPTLFRHPYSLLEQKPHRVACMLPACPPCVLRVSSTCLPRVVRVSSVCPPRVLRVSSACLPCVLRVSSVCLPGRTLRVDKCRNDTKCWKYLVGRRGPPLLFCMYRYGGEGGSMLL